MRTRYIVLVIVGCAWLAAAAIVSLATFSLVDESGWSDMPLFGWLAVLVVVGLAPALVYGGYRWIARGTDP